MRAAVNDTKRTVFERLAAWFITGPPGHFASGAVDWAALLWQASKRRGRRRDR
jgi:hypothetical protein